jgi:hypothetical protein
MFTTCLNIVNVYMSSTEKLYTFNNILKKTEINRLALSTWDVSVCCECLL